MSDLINMIHTSNCQEHQQPLARICIKVECSHKFRGLCRRCPKLDDICEVNVANLFDFMEEQDQQSSNSMIDDYRTKALYFQQFMRQRILIEYHLDQIQAILETAFYSISESFISKLKKLRIGAQARQIDTQALGELLSRTIQTTQDKKLMLIDNNQLQNKFNDAMNLIEEMKCIGQLSINFQKEQKQVNQQQNEVYKEYKLSKTIISKEACFSLCFSHDETQIAASQNNKIQIFNDLQKQGNWVQYGEPLLGHDGFIYQVQFNHNSTQIVSCDEMGWIIIYGKLDGIWTIQHTIQKNEFPLHSVCFNHNSTLLASGSCDNNIQIFELSNSKWKQQQVLTEHKLFISKVCFNHNSTMLASGSCDESIIIWEQNNSKKWIIKQKWTGHIGGVQFISFNTESTLLVSGGKDNLVKVWAVDNKGIWGCSYTLTGHTNYILSVYFNLQSNMIISNSEDVTLRIWKVNQNKNWECVQTIKSNYESRCGIIINKGSQIYKSLKNQIIIYEQ